MNDYKIVTNTIGIIYEGKDETDCHIEYATKRLTSILRIPWSARPLNGIWEYIYKKIIRAILVKRIGSRQSITTLHTMAALIQ
jgi:hypothetical protein